jgi:hypothetical protein
MKVVYNGAFGGYRLSDNMIAYLRERGVLKTDEWDEYYCIPRHNKTLVEAVELYQHENLDLSIEDVQGTGYYISDYDGLETVIYPNCYGWVEVKEE